MKHIILACAFSVVASAALAGGYGDPVVAPDVVMTDTVASAGGDEWVLALMVILTIGLGITGQ